jgi:hypothetical protein
MPIFLLILRCASNLVNCSVLPLLARDSILYMQSAVDTISYENAVTRRISTNDSENTTGKPLG